MFEKYRSKPFGGVKKIRNRSGSRFVSLPEEESLLRKSVDKSVHKPSQKYRYKSNHKQSRINRAKVEPEPESELKSEPIDVDTTSDPGIKEFQEYYKISQDLLRLEVQVKKIQKKANMFRNARVLNSKSNDESGDEVGDDIVSPTN